MQTQPLIRLSDPHSIDQTKITIQIPPKTDEIKGDKGPDGYDEVRTFAEVASSPFINRTEEGDVS